MSIEDYRLSCLSLAVDYIRECNGMGNPVSIAQDFIDFVTGRAASSVTAEISLADQVARQASDADAKPVAARDADKPSGGCEASAPLAEAADVIVRHGRRHRERKAALVAAFDDFITHA